MSYDEWKTTDPGAEFLGDNRQAGETEMSEPGANRLLDCELRLKSLSDKNIALRELNAELQQALIEILPYAKMWIGDDYASIKWAEEILEKAEKLK
jgi:hypothetical protein